MILRNTVAVENIGAQKLRHALGVQDILVGIEPADVVPTGRCNALVARRLKTRDAMSGEEITSLMDRNAVMAHRDIAMAVRDRVAALVAQGKSEDEVVAAKVTADLDGKIQQAGTTGERFVRQAYADLKATR